MQITFTVKNNTYAADTAAGKSIAIPVAFGGPQPNTYNVERASAAPYRSGEFVGDVRQGGSCNFESYTMVPHCNGTHTECIGHITRERLSLHDVPQELAVPATLISIVPEPGVNCGESYIPAFGLNDLVVTRGALEEALANAEGEWLNALVVRTLPNDESKRERNYMEVPPPFFTNDAMLYIKELGVRHLLVDFPSLDRLFDDGMLSNHRIYWNIALGTAEATTASLTQKTVTEMIYADDEITDGRYLLSMQYPSFIADAAPSKPVLYPVSEVHP